MGAALLVDEFTLKFAEKSADSESLCCIRRRLTILNGGYLSRGKNQNELLSKAAPLSRQLFISVMDSSQLLETPLLVSACSVQALSVVEVLLACNMGSTYAQLERQDVNGCTALHMACASPSRSARAPLAKMLLDARSDPNAQDEEGCTALHYAATASDTALVALLMLQGA